MSNEPVAKGDQASAISAVRNAWSILAHGAPTAADALVAIAENGKSEIARVQASQAILDRVGLAPPKEVHFRVQPSEGNETQQLSPAEVIRNKLAALAPALMPADITGDGAAPDDIEGLADGVIDAELIPMDDADNWSS